MRILLVEDSEKLSTYIGKALRKAGYAVDLTGDGEEGLYLAESINYDVLILDLMLPKLDGLSILTKLRKNGSVLHILVLTAKDTIEDRVNGLQKGADDYLVKPFAMEELIARVQVLGRRSHNIKNPFINIGRLVIDTASRTISRTGDVIILTPREYAILEYLALNQNRVVSRTEIEEHIYNDEIEIMSNVVNSAISSIRKKIDIPGTTSIIETKRGMGYIIKGWIK
ncbi:response regulator transcription factor [Desulfobacterales bacterium HSG16]|nr:response regulator transcription factor [Desulfobacterales bacterium HSG16]